MRLDDLLQKTSRTFALSIPLLPGETREAVGIAYLLFRIADTFEDSTGWPLTERLRALDDFVKLLHTPDVSRAQTLGAQWVAARPCEQEGYLELLGATDEVITALLSLSAEARVIVVRHAIRTAEGMASFVARPSERNALEITSLPELRAYCYVVAGIVGELLTELFQLADATLARAPHAEALTSRAVLFGEALQLVNILKDAGDDAKEKRSFLPPGVDRASLFALARSDLDAAREYVRALEIAHSDRGFVAFTALPVLLAEEALAAVEARGVGAKVARSGVMQIAAALDARLAAGERAIP